MKESKTMLRKEPTIFEHGGAAATLPPSGLKNAGAQIGAAQAVAASRRYDASGSLAALTGTWNGPFGYGGGFGYQEDATGRRLLRHRDYDSSTGRFITRDPVMDGRNWHTDAANDPALNSDPTGLTPLILGVGAAALAVAGLVKLAQEAGELFDDARRDKIDPNDNVWGDDEKLDDRWRNEVPGLIKRTAKLTKEAIEDNYVYGPIGEAGGDGVKIGLETYKLIKERAFPE